MHKNINNVYWNSVFRDALFGNLTVFPFLYEERTFLRLTPYTFISYWPECREGVLKLGWGWKISWQPTKSKAYQGWVRKWDRTGQWGCGWRVWGEGYIWWGQEGAGGMCELLLRSACMWPCTRLPGGSYRSHPRGWPHLLWTGRSPIPDLRSGSTPVRHIHMETSSYIL